MRRQTLPSAGHFLCSMRSPNLWTHKPRTKLNPVWRQCFLQHSRKNSKAVWVTSLFLNTKAAACSFFIKKSKPDMFSPGQRSGETYQTTAVSGITHRSLFVHQTSKHSNLNHIVSSTEIIWDILMFSVAESVSYEDYTHTTHKKSGIFDSELK